MRHIKNYSILEFFRGEGLKIPHKDPLDFDDCLIRAFFINSNSLVMNYVRVYPLFLFGIRVTCQ